MSKQSFIGIIPARGGSKGIKRKNLIEINGKPLIKYTIDQSNKSKMLDDFIISTDDKEIFAYCKSIGAPVPFLRPKYLARDSSSSSSVVKHSINFLEKNGKYYDYIILLQPTCPFSPKNIIDDAIKLITKYKFDALVSLVDVSANHPFRMYKTNSKGIIQPIFKSKSPMLARQLLPKIYIRSGDLYIIKTSIFKRTNNLLANKTYGYVINEKNHINIDTHHDLILAKEIAKNIK